MSVIVEFAMFPTDKGESVSKQVSEVISVIKQSGFNYQLTAMGTLVETDTFKEATGVMNRCYAVLESECNRVYCTATLDVRKGGVQRMKQKMVSIEDRIGLVNK